jgi:hypothetical protein
VDKDNEYFAEAASSKFLTGRMSTVKNNRNEFVAGRPLIAPHYMRRFGNEENIDTQLQEEEEPLQLQSQTINALKDVSTKQKPVKPKPKSINTGMAMGRSVRVYDRHNGKSNGTGRSTRTRSTSFRASGLYR